MMACSSCNTNTAPYCERHGGQMKKKRKRNRVRGWWYIYMPTGTAHRFVGTVAFCGLVSKRPKDNWKMDAIVDMFTKSPRCKKCVAKVQKEEA